MPHRLILSKISSSPMTGLLNVPNLNSLGFSNTAAFPLLSSNI